MLFILYVQKFFNTYCVPIYNTYNSVIILKLMFLLVLIYSYIIESLLIFDTLQKFKRFLHSENLDNIT